MIELKEGEALSSISNRFITLFKYMQYNSIININSANDFIIELDSTLALNIRREGIYTITKQLEAVLCITCEKKISVRSTGTYKNDKIVAFLVESKEINCYELAKILRNINIDFDRYISNTKYIPYQYYLPLIDKRNILIDNILNGL